jgi:hypothetical protein
MTLTNNEKKLLKEINQEPDNIEGYCLGLKWDVNFGKGVLGSLFKKGLAESEDMDGCASYDPKTDKMTYGVTLCVPYLTLEGEDMIEKYDLYLNS